MARTARLDQNWCAPALLGWLLVLLVANHASQANTVIKLLDGHDPVGIAAIAKTVCEVTEGSLQQLSRVSTISKLVDYFEKEVTSPEHSLWPCKERHENALHLLQDVLSVSNENVCSATKLALIEDFHNLYVSTHIDQEQRRKEDQRDMAPQMLRLVFMHYAMDVDAVCKRNLINNLDWDLKEKFGQDIDKQLFEFQGDQDEQPTDGRAAFGAIFKGAMQKFTDLYSVEQYEDVLMIWDLLEKSYLTQKMAADETAIKDEFDPLTGEPVRLLVKIKSRGYLDKVRDHCHYKLKPIYSKLILPIIKLADLGYSNRGEQFEIELNELKSSEQVRKWYSVTQLCEAMLPVRYYEDASLQPNDIAIITKREADELEPEGELKLLGSVEDADGNVVPATPTATSNVEKVKLEYEPSTNSLVGVDSIDSVSSLESQHMVRKIKSNLSVRDRVTGRAIVNLLRNMKKQFKASKIGRFFFSKKSAETLAHPKVANEKVDRFENEDIGRPLTDSLKDVDEEEVLKLEGAAGSTSRVMKSSKGAKGIGQRRRYKRKGDVDMIQEMRADALSYTRTKSWSEIFAGWGDVLSAIAPSRTKMIICAVVIIAILLLILMCSMTAAMYAG